MRIVQIHIAKCEPIFFLLIYNTIEKLTPNILRFIYFFILFKFQRIYIVCGWWTSIFKLTFRVHYGSGFLIKFMVTFRLIKTKNCYIVSKCTINILYNIQCKMHQKCLYCREPNLWSEIQSDHLFLLIILWPWASVATGDSLELLTKI